MSKRRVTKPKRKPSAARTVPASEHRTVSADVHDEMTKRADGLAAAIAVMGQACEGQIGRLKTALAESVAQHADYARQLNERDGGERKVFVTADQWLHRMAEIGHGRPEVSTAFADLHRMIAAQASGDRATFEALPTELQAIGFAPVRMQLLVIDWVAALAVDPQVRHDIAHAIMRSMAAPGTEEPQGGAQFVCTLDDAEKKALPHPTWTAEQLAALGWDGDADGGDW